MVEWEEGGGREQQFFSPLQLNSALAGALVLHLYFVAVTTGERERERADGLLRISKKEASSRCFPPSHHNPPPSPHTPLQQTQPITCSKSVQKVTISLMYSLSHQIDGEKKTNAFDIGVLQNFTEDIKRPLHLGTICQCGGLVICLVKINCFPSVMIPSLLHFEKDYFIF